MNIAADNNVLIELFSKERITSTGILIPETARQRKNSGKIVSVGENVTDERITRDAIAYVVKGAGKEMEYEENGKTYILVKDYDILAFTEN